MTKIKKNNQKIIVAAMGLPFDKHGKYLLTRRHAPNIKAWHNKRQVCGGALEFGETLEEALVREFQEELNVTPKIIFPQPIVKVSIWYGRETDIKQDAQIVLTTYLVDIGNQKIDISGDDETNKIGWFTSEEVKKLDSLPMTKEIVQTAKRIVKGNSLL